MIATAFIRTGRPWKRVICNGIPDYKFFVILPGFACDAAGVALFLPDVHRPSSQESCFPSTVGGGSLAAGTFDKGTTVNMPRRNEASQTEGH